MTQNPSPDAQTDDRAAARAEWIGLLARASVDDLDAGWRALGDDRTLPAYTVLRAPERGLVMVRGRAGGDGGPFNLGEMSVTRCSVRLADGTVGHGYVAGRSARHAELAAVFDGLLQTGEWAEAVAAKVIGPVRAALAMARAQTAAKTAATKVEFFTMVREQAAGQE
jgi:alpha-D-ribose 1-methylphosphonate 5-triphosphate synthase subunit PhnG